MLTVHWCVWLGLSDVVYTTVKYIALMCVAQGGMAHFTNKILMVIKIQYTVFLIQLYEISRQNYAYATTAALD